MKFTHCMEYARNAISNKALQLKHISLTAYMSHIIIPSNVSHPFIYADEGLITY